MLTMFCHSSFCQNSAECHHSQMALHQPSLYSFTVCQCRRPQASVDGTPTTALSSSLNMLLPLPLVLTLCTFLLLASPSVCSPPALVPKNSDHSVPIPPTQFASSSPSFFSSSSSSSSSEESSVQKSPKGGEKVADEWDEEVTEQEQVVKMKHNPDQLKKSNPHRMVVKRQMKRAAMASEAEEGKKPMGEEPEEGEQHSCTVRIQVVKKVKGKCVRLQGGQSACQSADYLDPVNEDCMFG